MCITLFISEGVQRKREGEIKGERESGKGHEVFFVRNLWKFLDGHWIYDDSLLIRLPSPFSFPLPILSGDF